ncbi:tyrosine-type recombinase/integrase [Azotobacter beijerinckii]|uniref:tyrosine-type recombinase/integrase n=1 Tax=Azotobacter beijerinckii TaxID=170623 RepID=UPI002952E911|nr:integrase [Azotobacter beijerinckii]MDV7210787.1 integrase [Azotobacter beijerinckii]
MTKRESTQLSHQQLVNMTGRMSEPADLDSRRGGGSLMFERRASGTIEAYFRQRSDGGEFKRKIGTLKVHAKGTGLTLTELRDEARRLSKLSARHGDLRAYLAKEEAEREAERRTLEAQRSYGTFADLFLSYIEDRRGSASDGVVLELERLFKRNMKPHSSLMAMKARDVRPDHVQAIVQPIWDRGSQVQAARMRSFILAAFSFGLRAEYSVSRASPKRFEITANPAMAVHVPDASQPGTRALSDAELALFWRTIVDVPGVGDAMARLFRFVVATGGQRIAQVVREPWSSYDLEAGVLSIVERKGRGDPYVNMIPLSERAIEILAEVDHINGGHLLPWTGSGRAPFTIPSMSHAIDRWLASKHAVLDGGRVPNFSPRDLRRTCAQLMQRAGVDDTLSDLLQNHGVGGLVARHYRNDPAAALPKKWQALAAFDLALAGVLGAPAGN